MDAAPRLDRPLRFCMVTTFYPPYSFGGDGVFVQRLAHALAERGHHVEVVHCVDAYRLLAPRGADPPPDDRPGVIVHRLRSPLTFLSPLATQQTGRPVFKTAALRRVLARGFDVVHFHNVSLIGGPGVLAMGRGIKLYTMHEFWLLCPTHVLFKFNREVCAERSCLRCQLVYRRPPQLWRHTRLLDRAVRHVDMFISPSRHTLAKHLERWPDLPFAYLPNFVDEAPLSARDGDAPPYFLFVGRLETLKGLHTLLPLFRDYPHATLRVAGAGSQEAVLAALAAGSPGIRFLGHQSHAALQPLYRNAIALIVPSINFESAPLVIAEAFRQQTPVLVRDLGAMPEIVADSGGGLVYRDERELRALMDRLRADRGWRDELGMRGYRAVREKWTADAHLAGYFGIVRQALVRRSEGLVKHPPRP